MPTRKPLDPQKITDLRIKRIMKIRALIVQIEESEEIIKKKIIILKKVLRLELKELKK